MDHSNTPTFGGVPVAMFLLLAVACSGCSSLEYDLSSVRVPVSAKPAGPDSGPTESFEIREKSILWVHGLFGRSTPDIAGLVTEAAANHDRVASFRVTSGAVFHDWLATHLSLTLIRMKTVVIEGELVRDAP